MGIWKRIGRNGRMSSLVVIRRKNGQRKKFRSLEKELFKAKSPNLSSEQEENSRKEAFLK